MPLGFLLLHGVWLFKIIRYQYKQCNEIRNEYMSLVGDLIYFNGQQHIDTISLPKQKHNNRTIAFCNIKYISLFSKERKILTNLQQIFVKPNRFVQ